MNDCTLPKEALIAPAQTMRKKFVKLLIILAGIVFGQAILYGPSLMGEKILLPLDLLDPAGFLYSTHSGNGENCAA